MSIYKGTHGTCVSHAQNILDCGFYVQDNVSIRGFGIYFWKKTPYSKDLAIAWYLGQLNREKYSRLKDDKCALVDASINVNADDNVLDTSDEVVDELLYSIIQRVTNLTPNRTTIAKSYEKLIQVWEQKTGSEIHLVIARVVAPKGSYYSQFMNDPVAYIARNPTCISLENISYYSKEDIELWKNEKD